jgi:hypothetical protein
MLVRHRSGRLILRRAEDRERQKEVNASSRRNGPVLLAIACGVLAIGGLWQHIAAALVGGVFTAVGPVLLWIAFVLRPDEHIGEDL